MKLLGVDPGKSGAIVAMEIFEDGKKWHAEVSSYNMPETEKDMWELMFNLHRLGFEFALIEKVHAFPGQGVTAVWTFSGNYHGLRMAMMAAGIAFNEIRPHAWQKGVGIPKRKKDETKSKFKNRLKAKAQQLFVNIDVTLKNADALLITYYHFLSSNPTQSWPTPKQTTTQDS